MNSTIEFGICNDQNEVIARFTAPLTIRSNQPVFVSDTLSLKRQITVQSAQRWEIETGLEPLNTTANELFVNLVTKGYHQPVKVLFPQNFSVWNKTTSVVNPRATGTLYSNQITVSENIGLIPAGTFITFDNHSKIYITTNNLNGSGTVGIFPNLRLAVNNAVISRIFYSNFLYDTDVVSGMVYSDGILMDTGTVRLVERL